jgi:hypothetical protein
MDYIANAGARGYRGEEGFDVVFGGYDGLTEVERDECRKCGGLSGVGSGFDLFGEAGGG